MKRNGNFLKERLKLGTRLYYQERVLSREWILNQEWALDHLEIIERFFLYLITLRSSTKNAKKGTERILLRAERNRTKRERNDWKKERERNDLATGPCSRTERNDLKKVGTCPALLTVPLINCYVYSVLIRIRVIKTHIMFNFSSSSMSDVDDFLENSYKKQIRELNQTSGWFVIKT